MFKALQIGFSYGLSSGVITTLGLMVGVATSTNSKLAVIGSIITIAVADALSDALGIHISTEFSGGKETKEIWWSTLFTFLSKFIFAIIFVIPVLLAPSLFYAMLISIVLGIIILGIFSYFMAKQNKANIKNTILEHIAMTILVITLSYFIGRLINNIFA